MATHRCSKCGNMGHNKRTCKKKKIPRKKVKAQIRRLKKRIIRKKQTARKKKTIRKKSKKKIGKVTGYFVAATYSSKLHGWGTHDRKIISAGGRRNNAGSGTMISTGARDIDFMFKQKTAAENCKKRLLKLKKQIRGLKVKMWPIID